MIWWKVTWSWAWQLHQARHPQGPQQSSPVNDNDDDNDNDGDGDVDDGNDGDGDDDDNDGDDGDDDKMIDPSLSCRRPSVSASFSRACWNGILSR